MKQKIEGGTTTPIQETGEKESSSEIKYVMVKEWFTQDKDGLVYLNWEFQDGKRMKRLTPFDMIPIIELGNKPYDTQN